jgi:hypothetical protein
VRSNTKQLIKLETYDCDPGGGVVYYDLSNANQAHPEALPPDLTIDPYTGILSGYLKYTPAYSTTYTFNIRVYKTSTVTSGENYRQRTFTITYLGAITGKIYFKTDTMVGTLFQGEQSELSIVAIHEDPNIRTSYSLLSGSLPPGLTLSYDGAIQGKVEYDTNIHNTTEYSFTVRATDINSLHTLEKVFKIQVLPYSGEEYTSIFLQPLLSSEKRNDYAEFINDQSIFELPLLYRPFDPAFGTQKLISFTLEYGIKKLDLTDYVPAIQKYFSRKKLYFGNLKSAIARDEQGDILYEVIYVELVDTLVNNSGEPVGDSLEFPNGTYYPNSIDNMRADLERIAKVDEYLLPKFMRTVQDSTGVPLGRILCMPICYCLPGHSLTLIRRIESYGINFSQFNFDIDRITIFNTLDNSSTKYLLFPNREVLQ